MRRAAFLVAVAVGVLIIAGVAAWALVEPEPPPRPAPAVASTEEVCREYAKAALVMADALDRAFRRHADAHHDWREGKIPFGPVEQPGTVLFIWRQTLHDGQMHAGHYRELRDAWRATCLGEPA